MALPRRLPFFYGWLIVAVGFLVWILSVGQTYTFGIFFKPVSGELGWGRAETSLAFSIRSLTMGLSASLWGLLTDRYGPRLVVAVGGALLGVAYGFLSRTDGLVYFYFLFFLVGMGSGATSQSALAATVSRWFQEKRGLALSIMTMGGGLGQVLLPFLVVFFIVNFNWRVAFLALGIIMGLVIVVAAQALRRDPGEKGHGHAVGGTTANRDAPRGVTTREALASRAFWTVFLSEGVMTIAHMIVMMHLVNYVTDPAIALSPPVAAGLLSVIGGANVAGKVIVGAVSDRIGRRSALALCFGLATSTLFWLLFARSIWGFYVFAIFYGIAYGGWIPMFPALLGDLFGTRSIGAIIGALQLAGASGGALGAWLGGFTFDVTRSYTLAFVLGGSLFVVSTLAILSLKPVRLGRGAG